MTRAFYILIGALFLVYLLFATAFYHSVKEKRICRKVEVIIDDSLQKHFVTANDVFVQLKRDRLFPVGKSLRAINTDKIEKNLLQNNMLSDVQVFKTASGKIRIKISQKMPVLRVMSLNGNYYIDSKGTMMPVSYRYSVRVPIVSGYVENRFAMNDLFKFALFLQGNEFWNDQIDQIYVNEDHEIELIPRVGDQKIILGSIDDFEEKLVKLRLFYEQAIPKLGWERYSIINLKYNGQIVCTKK